MSEDKIKLAAALPKADLNGFADGLLAGELATAVTEGRQPAPRVAIVVYDVKKVEVDPATHDRTAVLRILRAQPVHAAEGLKAVETVLEDEWSAEHGPMMPFEVGRITKAAFADLPRDYTEIDAAEEKERENMSPADELRRHLANVHGREDANLLTDGEAESQHEKAHDGDLGTLEHDREWIGWSRADLEAAYAGSDETGSDDGGLDFDLADEALREEAEDPNNDYSMHHDPLTEDEQS